MSRPGNVREFCRELLESGELKAKLRPPRSSDGALLCDDAPGPPLQIDAPARSGPLRMQPGLDRLPRLHELRDPAARTVCLERFANHELMAVELFAWVLLAYPEMPVALRGGYLRVLEEEQGHLGMYLDRLSQLGSGLGDSPVSDYFWQQVPAIRDASDGPLTFLCVMGLTLEQANLDYTLIYRDAFAGAGDEPSATAIGQVHEDEIGHVRLAATWLRRLSEKGRSDVEAYSQTVPFPLSAARAKARRFDAASRRRAGLSEEMIEFVRNAKPYEDVRRAGRIERD